jgi:hypothetical protein
MSKSTIVAGLAVLGCVCLLCPISSWLVEVPLEIAIGWTIYLYRVLPQVEVHWPAVLTGAACLAGFAAGLHGLLRWLTRSRNPFGIWPLPRTWAIAGLILLLFVAGIATVGVTHQTGWLLTSPEPLTRSGSIREYAARTQQQNNLKQIALAMYSYAEVEKTFPPAALRDKEGRPLLSWRVLILPYIEQENLYKEFRLDEPWDSPHNLRLLPRMPKTFMKPWPLTNPPPLRTHYQVFVGNGAAFEGHRGLSVPADFPDGASNTILVVEAAESVPWTKPADMPYDPARPLPPLGDLTPKVFQAALVDGSVRQVDRTLSERTLRAAITRNGGDELGPDW